MAAAIEEQSFPGMTVKFVWCEATYCRGHASNLMTARSMFKNTNEPFLIVQSDHLFEPSLLAKFAREATLPAAAPGAPDAVKRLPIAFPMERFDLKLSPCRHLLVGPARWL